VGAKVAHRGECRGEARTFYSCPAFKVSICIAGGIAGGIAGDG